MEINYFLSLLLFVVIAIFIDGIHIYFQMYMHFGILYRINFNNTAIVYKIVQFVNVLENFVEHIPYLFLYKEGKFYYYCAGIYEVTNWNAIPNMKEKFWVCVEKLFVVLKHLFRINLIYIIYVLYFFGRDIIEKMFYILHVFRPNIHQLVDNFRNCLIFIQANGWLLFILFVSLVMLLKGILERKLSGLYIDEELENKKADFKQIAEHIDAIREKLYECANISQTNEKILLRLLNQLDYSIAHKVFSDIKTLKNEIESCLKGLNDDLDTLKIIKNSIKSIEDLGGKKLYACYHLDIWKNVTDLHIASSSTQFLHSRKELVIRNINYLIDCGEEKNLKLLYDKLVKSVRNYWIDELDYYYQLSRYFKFIKRRKRKYINLKKEILLTDRALLVAERTKNK